MEGGQLGTCFPSFVLPDHFALSFPSPLHLPTSNPNRLLQMPFDQGEAGNDGVILPSDQCGLYLLPFGCSGAAAVGGGGNPTAGFMPSVEEVRFAAQLLKLAMRVLLVMAPAHGFDVVHVMDEIEDTGLVYE
ncbi:hypothetical protein EJB05_20540, partial [Eragrostis curvula]